MAVLDINFDEVSDSFEPLPPGVYEMEVDGVPEVQMSKANKPKLVVKLRVSSGEQSGRRLQDHISFEMQTRIKQLFLSAGLQPVEGRYDTNDIAGRVVLVNVKGDSYVDDDNIQHERAKVAGYVVQK